MKKPAIILDRDGVINQVSAQFIKNVAEFQLYERSLIAISKLHQAGWPIFIITNQAGLAYGLFDEEILADIHRSMFKAVINAGGDIQAIYYCPHHPESRCACRKPRTGLFEQLALEHDIDLMESYYIGDKATDVEAGLNAGCTPVLVRSGQGLENFDTKVVCDNEVMIFDDLLDFVENYI